ASSCWIVLPSRSVRLDIFSQSTKRIEPQRTQRTQRKPQTEDGRIPALRVFLGVLCVLCGSNSLRLQYFDLVIDQAYLRHRADEIDELAQRAFDVAAVVADHRQAQDRAAVLVERADLGDRHVVRVGDAVLDALDDPPLVLE